MTSFNQTIGIFIIIQEFLSYKNITLQDITYSETNSYYKSTSLQDLALLQVV